MMKTNVSCQFLDWDTQFFGHRIARITKSRLNDAELAEIVLWCRDERIECVYWFVASDEAEAVMLAEKYGFHLVDIRISMMRPLQKIGTFSQLDAALVIRPVITEDIPLLKAITRTAYQDTRFYYDPNVPIERCQALYETWIEQNCYENRSIVFVAEFAGQVEGYVSCSVDENDNGKIGLIGVDREARGKGLGRHLIKASLKWFGEQNVKQVMVVTQGRNVKAQRLYQTCGFLTNSLELVYHGWLLAF